MVKIDLQKTLNAPIDKVFELLTDHGNYQQFRGIDESELLREGKTEKNGLGAQRRIKAGPVTFFEDITEFERPTLFEYRIVKMRPPILNHLLGRVELTAQGDKTEVRWLSDSVVRIPLLGRLVDKRLSADGHKAFSGILRAIETKLAE